jgi:hypothetical protein
MPESIKLLICPACGAPLDPQPHETTVKCDYCGNSTLLPSSVREPVSHGNIASSSAGVDLNSMVNQAAQLKEVVALVRSGKKIEAVKLIRELTGMDLKESKEAVDAIAAGEPFTLDMKTQLPGTSVGAGSGRAVNASGSKLGRWIGCGVALLVLGILASVLVPILATLPAIAAIGGAPDLPPVVASVIPPDIQATSTPAYANLELSFGEEGQGPGMFTDSRFISVDQAGNIYVGDFEDGRVQIFDSQGGFLRQINIGDTNLRGLAVKPDGTLYLSYDGEIYIYDGDTGESIGQITRSDQQYFESIALAADGSLMVISRGENILRFGPDGNLDLEIPDAISSISGDAELNAKVAVDGLGNIYALGTFNEAVFIFSPDGDFVDRFGGESESSSSFGIDPGHFRAANAVAVDGYGRIFVSDIMGIQIFDSEGQYLDLLEVEGVAFDLAFDLQNNLYIASNARKALKYEVQKP